MADPVAAAIARIEARHARFVQADRLNRVVVRQRRELAAENQPKTEPKD